MLSQFLSEISLLIFNFLYLQLSLHQNRLLVYIFLSCQIWFYNLSCCEDIIISTISSVSIVTWMCCYNVSRSWLQILYSILYKWLKTADCQLILDIFEQIVHLQSDYQWFLNWRLLMSKLNNNSSSYIVLIIVECTIFVINKSSVIDDCKSFSYLDNDDFCLDSWSQIYS